MEGTLASDENPLELAINNPAFFLADTEPMGVVAEVIRNDMGDALGIMVYDDATRQVHKFRASQLVMRPDGSVTVLPSWFKKSRDIIKNIEPMEQAVPAIKQARRKGVAISAEDAARATAAAGPQVQRYIDEAVILRSQLIGKLHGLFEKQAASEEQLRQLVSPGLFGRGSDADRQVQIATLKRSNRLNAQTIHAMRDFLARMDSSYLFPKDLRYRTLFRVEEAAPQPQAAPAPVEGAEEFETFEEAEEFETFEEAEEFETFQGAETFERVDEFEDVPDEATFEDMPPLPPPPAAAPSFADVEALPDSDDITVSQPSLMAVGAPGWAPPRIGTTAPPPAIAAHHAAPPPPPGATAAVPPTPIPSMDEFEATGQRKLDGRAAEPEPVAKKAGLLGRLRRGKEKRERAPAMPVSQPAPEEFAPVDDFETFEEEEGEFETFEEEFPSPPASHRPFVMSSPPTQLPPPPAYVPHAPAPVETFQEVPVTEEFAPVVPASPPPPPPAATPAPRPAAMPPAAPAPAPAPPPVDEFETFEEEVATFEAEPEPMPAPAPAPEPEPEGRPLDAEKDIDAILAMALGKAPPPKSKPTARPGVRETTTPMQNILAKSKYRRND